MRNRGVRETAGRRALVAMAAGAAVLVGAPVLATGVMAGWGPSYAEREAAGNAGGGEPGSVIPDAFGRWVRRLGPDSLVPTPGSAVLAGVGVVVAVVRRRT